MSLPKPFNRPAILKQLAYALVYLLACLSFIKSASTADQGQSGNGQSANSPSAGGAQEVRLPRNGEWEVLFEEGTTVDEYARQLDYFGIEVGVIDKKGQIQYAAQLSKHKAVKRLGAKADEKRLAITWKRGSLQTIDRKLLTRSGINTKDKDLAHYYPRKVEDQLYQLEKDYAGRDPAEISRTRFKVRGKPRDKGAYEFYVDEQDYRETTVGKPSASIESTGK